MRLADSRGEARFRSELVDWLAENSPATERASDPPRSAGHIPEWAADWQRTLFDARWLVPRWPDELGGRDASAIEQLIYLEELSSRQVPRSANPQGLDVCAPTLADHGAGARHDEWLMDTLQGGLAWCIAVDHVDLDDLDGSAARGGPGRSTPSARDDAPHGVALVDRRTGRVLTGAVDAPPGAADADRCLLAVGVEAGAGSKGEDDEVAVVALDLDADGVSRPAVDDPDARLVLTEVAVDEIDLLGEPGRGWAVLQSVRARLRSVRWLTSLLATRRALDALADIGRARGLADDGVFRDTLASLRVESDAVRALAYRALAVQAAGRPAPELAMLPLVTARVEERTYLTGLEVLGADGLDLGLDGPMGWHSGSWAREWGDAAAAASAAGGLGAERDRIAGRMLGLSLG